MTTSATISNDLRALDAHLAIVAEKADALALEALGGSDKAKADLAAALAEIERGKAERAILERLQAVALNREAGAADTASQADREAAMGEARDHAARLLKLAGEIDEIAARLIPSLAAIDAAETGLRDALRRAGRADYANGAIVGRQGLSGLGLDTLMRTVRGDRFAHDPRPLASIAASAWADLLETE